MNPRIRWRAWFGDMDLELPFPESWDVREFGPRDRPDMSDEQVGDIIRNPIGTRPLREIAMGKRTACVVVDDLSRPTPVERLLGPILQELNQAGIPDERITILAGVGNHRQMTRDDFVKKIGVEFVTRCPLVNHFSWDDCIRIGTTSHGTPVVVNRLFAESDVKVLTGSIVPHPVAGYAGGGKLVLPGVSSIDTATAFHGESGPTTGLALATTPARVDIDEAARMAGTDFIVNAIPTSRRGIGGLVAGDVVDAFQAGVKISQKMNATPTPAGWDICVLSAYPKDNEFIQHSLAYSIWRTAPAPIVHENGTVVIADACSEGAGFHSLAGPGMRLSFTMNLRGRVAPRDLVFFAPGVKESEIRMEPDPSVYFRAEWSSVIDLLERKHGRDARVAVFPCAAIQVAEGHSV